MTSFRLRIEGAVARPAALGFEDLAALPYQIADVGSVAPGRSGGAVRLQSLLEKAGLDPGASQVTLSSLDGTFTQSAPLSALRDAVLVYRIGDEALPESLGGPVRFLIPNLEECLAEGVDRCTNVKGLGAIRIEPAA